MGGLYGLKRCSGVFNGGVGDVREGASLGRDEVSEVGWTKGSVDVFTISVRDEESIGGGILDFGWALFAQLGPGELNRRDG